MASDMTHNTTATKNLKHFQGIVRNVKFDLEESSYSLLEIIGCGSYGVVCSAVNSNNGQKVAIKKLANAFNILTIAKRTYREIKILKHFHHDNIITIKDMLLPKSEEEFNDVYVVQDLMETDLHQIIHSKQVLTEEHIRYFLYQILRGLKYIHSAHIIHRDLKPSNLLVNANCELKIGDFGLARNIATNFEQHKHFMTEYVATRWYRAPELMLSLLEYTAEIDIWSVGCILAEMLGRKQLFPGKDYIHQLKLILHYLGTPSDSLLSSCKSDNVRNFIKGLGFHRPIPWVCVYPNSSSEAINLLHQMLKFDSKERCSALQAICHPFLAKYHDPDDEPVCIPAFHFDFDCCDLTCDRTKQLVIEEIRDFHQKLEQARMIIQNSQLCPVNKADDVLPVSLKKHNLPGSSDVSIQNIHSLDKNSSSFPDESVGPTNTSTTHQIQKKNVINKNKVNKGPISMDTRALIKAALLSGALRKSKTGSTNYHPKSQVTALSRQREREAKRKKRFEHAKEKKKKLDGKVTDNAIKAPLVLSKEDENLLARWKQMQDQHKTKSNEQFTNNSELQFSTAAISIKDTKRSDISSTLTNDFTKSKDNISLAVGTEEYHQTISNEQSKIIAANLSSTHHNHQNHSKSVAPSTTMIFEDHSCPQISKWSDEQIQDCVSILTKQFSKSQMDNVFTLALPTSMHGSGSGYGIGKEIEDIIKESLPVVSGAEVSQCDSPSLFADLLEATSLKPSDLEALQQELEQGSPMVFCD